MRGNTLSWCIARSPNWWLMLTLKNFGPSWRFISVPAVRTQHLSAPGSGVRRECAVRRSPGIWARSRAAGQPQRNLQTRAPRSVRCNSPPARLLHERQNSSKLANAAVARLLRPFAATSGSASGAGIQASSENLSPAVREYARPGLGPAPALGPLMRKCVDSRPKLCEAFKFATLVAGSRESSKVTDAPSGQRVCSSIQWTSHMCY